MPEPLDWIQVAVTYAQRVATIDIFCAQQPLVTTYVAIDPSPDSLQTIAATIRLGSPYYRSVASLRREALRRRLCGIRTLYDTFEGELSETRVNIVIGVELALASAWLLGSVPEGFENARNKLRLYNRGEAPRDLCPAPRVAV